MGGSWIGSQLREEVAEEGEGSVGTFTLKCSSNEGMRRETFLRINKQPVNVNANVGKEKR